MWSWLFLVGCFEPEPTPWCVETGSESIPYNEPVAGTDGIASLDAFEAGFPLAVDLTGEATLQDTFRFDGVISGASSVTFEAGEESPPEGATCPTGAMLRVLFEGTLTSDAGFELEGPGELWVPDGDPSSAWVEATFSGVSVPDAVAAGLTSECNLPVETTMVSAEFGQAPRWPDGLSGQVGSVACDDLLASWSDLVSGNLGAVA